MILNKNEVNYIFSSKPVLVSDSGTDFDLEVEPDVSLAHCHNH